MKKFFYFFSIIFIYTLILGNTIIPEVWATNTTTPKLQVPIPNMKFEQVSEKNNNDKIRIKTNDKEQPFKTYLIIPWIQVYINGIYKFLLAVSGIVAVTMITIGGFMYAASGGNQNIVGKAKEYISSAVIGLILLFLVYTIFYIINPRITEQEGLRVRIPDEYKETLLDNNEAKENAQKKCSKEETIEACHKCIDNDQIRYCRTILSNCIKEEEKKSKENLKKKYLKYVEKKDLKCLNKQPLKGIKSESLFNSWRADDTSCNGFPVCAQIANANIKAGVGFSDYFYSDLIKNNVARLDICFKKFQKHISWGKLKLCEDHSVKRYPNRYNYSNYVSCLKNSIPEPKESQ